MELLAAGDHVIYTRDTHGNGLPSILFKLLFTTAVTIASSGGYFLPLKIVWHKLDTPLLAAGSLLAGSLSAGRDSGEL